MASILDLFRAFMSASPIPIEVDEPKYAQSRFTRTPINIYNFTKPGVLAEHVRDPKEPFMGLYKSFMGQRQPPHLDKNQGGVIKVYKGGLFNSLPHEEAHSIWYKGGLDNWQDQIAPLVSEEAKAYLHSDPVYAREMKRNPDWKNQLLGNEALAFAMETDSPREKQYVNEILKYLPAPLGRTLLRLKENADASGYGVYRRY